MMAMTIGGCSLECAERPRLHAMLIPIRIAPPGGEDSRIWSVVWANRGGIAEGIRLN